MSSTLSMVLMAAMVVPGSGPEMVSGEMEQGLDLRGEWEGMYWETDGQKIYKVKFGNDWLEYKWQNDSGGLRFKITDEGGGKLTVPRLRCVHVAIYRQEGDRVVIALRDSKIGRPVSFRTSDAEVLLILRRVKPGK